MFDEARLHRPGPGVREEAHKAQGRLELGRERTTQTKRRFEIFSHDIFDSRLKTHKLRGRLEGYYAFSLNYSDRLVFRLLEDGGVYLVEIGSHDVCY